ncbi:hypothetical protein SLEP1_g54248 [Rubroshorea leprosula]|uniref:Protein kinase domain-containing protein n=1 Tax=Rubroshorea leprosula TaxID=152421 RepID=A0AAV5MCX2_9ROSI|nr:hypothetical protein SLEP1_g54248 [Rubroshorea leprosula]
MNLKDPLIVTLVLFLLVISTQAAKCDRSCGGKQWQYPFGFSAGCKIPLNCSNSSIMINNHRVIDVDSESIRISIQPKCNRSLQAFHALYGKNYAPSSRNAIFLDICGDWSAQCTIPNGLVQTRFETGNCSSNSSINISCYMENRPDTDGFVNYNKLSRCRYFLTSLSTELSNDSGMALDVRNLELGWWVEGDKCQCSGNAYCKKISTPNGQPGFRCKCKEEFVGDGYHAGSGCRKGPARGFMTKVAAAAIVAGIAGLILLIFCFRKIFSPENRMFSILMKKEDCKDIEAFLRGNGHLALKRYSFKDVKKMTNNYSDKLGEGGFGAVYKGKLSDGCQVAVKVLDNAKDNGEAFINEVASISRTSHVNIVTLLGFCFEGRKRALIYEFVPNGSLEKFIHQENPLDQNHQLKWETLYHITVGIARGLEYLHRGCNTRILHFDIKPHNILLDGDFCPKISDFGLAKLCPRKESMVSMTNARGTIGYIAPEVFFRSIGRVSHKSDVYSYGMMVLEMVGERENIKNVESDDSSEYFPRWIYRRLELNEQLGIWSIRNDDDIERARKMTIVGLWCIQTNPSDRPPMCRVLEMLQGNLDSLEIPPKPFFSSPPRLPPEVDVFDSGFESFPHAQNLHVLCISLLAWNALSSSVPLLSFLFLCCSVGSTEKGASDDQVSRLHSWKYKAAANTDVELGNDVDSNLGCESEDPAVSDRL